MRICLSLLCLLALAPRAGGQTAPPRADVRGTVVDPSGAVVPGARVTLHPTGRQEVTDALGAFRFGSVGPGDYEIEAASPPFKSASVRLSVGRRAPDPLRIALSLAELHEEVSTVGQAGQVSLDPSENLDIVRLDEQFLRGLPVLGQDIIGAATLFLDPAALGAGGVTLVVDGMQTSEKGVSASAIQEVRINQNPYAAEFSRSGRGRIEVITKVGDPEFHGSFNFLFRDHHLDARNAFAVERPPEQRRIFEGHFTGPVGPSKKTTFLISANHEQEDLQAVVFARTPTGQRTENVATPQRQTEVSARLNHQFGKKHVVSVRYEFATDSTGNAGVGGFTLPEAGFDMRDRQHHLYYSHRTVLSPRVLNDFFMRTGSHDSRMVSRNRGVRTISVLDAFTGGGGQTDRRATENHVQLNDTVAWIRGKHTLKAGVNIPDISRRGSSDRSNFDGTYSFSSLEDYLLGLPFSFQQNRGDAHLAFVQRELGLFVQDDFRLAPNLSLGVGIRYDHQNYLSDRNNVAPRVSFAFAPDTKRKTVIRGGAGVFYDRTGPGAIGDTLRFDGRRLRQILLSNPRYPEPDLVGLQGIERPSNLVRFAHAIRSPYMIQYSAGVERQLHKKTSLTFGYTEIESRKVFRSRDLNAPLAPLFVRPDPSIGILRQVESSAGARSRSLEVGLRGNLSRYFNGMAQYTLSRSFNDSSGISSLPADSYDLSREWARAEFDERHRFRMFGTAKVGSFLSLGMNLALGSARPYNLTLGRDVNKDGSASDRPPGIGRNSLQGTGGATLDLRWSRELVGSAKKDGGLRVSIRADAFNVFNRVNYGGFVGNLSSPFFGLPVSARPARRMQLSLEIEY